MAEAKTAPQQLADRLANASEVAITHVLDPETGKKIAHLVGSLDEKRKTEIQEQRWHSLSEKQRAAIDFVAQIRSSPGVTQEYNPVAKEQIPICTEAAFILDSTAYNTTAQLSYNWYERPIPLEGLMVTWGDWQEVNGKMIFLAQETSDGTGDQQARTTTIDIDKVTAEADARFEQSSQIIVSLHHQHPTGPEPKHLHPDFQGTFSASDFPPAYSQTDSGRNPTLLGVVSRSSSGLQALAIGSYYCNRQGQISKLPGYYLIAGDQMGYVPFCQAGDSTEPQPVAAYDDQKKQWVSSQHTTPPSSPKPKNQRWH